MHKKFEINRTKIKGGCQSVTHNSKSDLPLIANINANKIGSIYKFLAQFFSNFVTQHTHYANYLAEGGPKKSRTTQNFAIIKNP